MQANGGQPFLHYQIVTQFSPAMAAIALVMITENHRGIRNLFERLVRWRVGYGWLLLAVLFEPVMFLTIALGYRLTVGDFPMASVTLTGSDLITVVVTFIFGLLRWGFAEEVGWRGWMLPNLQQKMSPFRASIVLAIVITLWHLRPTCICELVADRADGYLYGQYPEAVERIIITIPITLFMTLIFNRTKASLVPMMMYHSASNTSYFWLKETTGVVDTDFFRIVFLITVLVMTPVLSFAVIREGRASPGSTDSRRSMIPRN